jgi:hypothetical protein
MSLASSSARYLLLGSARNMHAPLLLEGQLGADVQGKQGIASVEALRMEQ